MPSVYRYARFEHGNDWLRSQLETVFVQRRLQLSQPLDIAPLACHDLVASGVDVHPALTLLLRNVTRRVRRTHDVLHGAADIDDLYQPD